MTRVVLGNRHAIKSGDLGTTFEALPKGKRATVVDFDDEAYSFIEMVTGVVDSKGIWTYHAVGPDNEVTTDDGTVVKRQAIHKNAKPAWVASDNDLLAQVLAQHFGTEVRDLEDVPGHPLPVKPSKPSGGGGGSAPRGPLMAMLWMMLAVPVLGLLLANLLPLLKVNAGNDFQYNQMAGSASATAVGKWVGITANVTAPAAGDTTLTGEITTAGGGLIRKVSTPAHTTGASSYTLTTVFTANGTDSLPVTIGKRGIFDALTGGNLIFESLVSPVATLNGSGDAMTETDTVSM